MKLLDTSLNQVLFAAYQNAWHVPFAADGERLETFLIGLYETYKIFKLNPQ